MFPAAFTPTVSGHETFVLRSTWLKKGYDVLQTYPDLFSRPDAAVDAQPVADLLEQTNQAVTQQTSYGGTRLIIDELGQHLEYAFRQHDAPDLFVLQTLAEMATRSGQTPCVLVTIVHQAFESYAMTAGAAQRMHWRKVQGRFVDVPFQEPDRAKESRRPRHSGHTHRRVHL